MESQRLRENLESRVRSTALTHPNKTVRSGAKSLKTAEIFLHYAPNAPYF